MLVWLILMFLQQIHKFYIFKQLSLIFVHLKLAVFYFYSIITFLKFSPTYLKKLSLFQTFPTFIITSLPTFTDLDTYISSQICIFFTISVCETNFFFQLFYFPIWLKFFNDTTSLKSLKISTK